MVHRWTSRKESLQLFSRNHGWQSHARQFISAIQSRCCRVAAFLVMAKPAQEKGKSGAMTDHWQENSFYQHRRESFSRWRRASGLGLVLLRSLVSTFCIGSLSESQHRNHGTTSSGSVGSIAAAVAVTAA
jgi:hypothetical protein